MGTIVLSRWLGVDLSFKMTMLLFLQKWFADNECMKLFQTQKAGAIYG